MTTGELVTENNWCSGVVVGCVVQWVERQSQLAIFPCPILGLQLTGNHLYG